MNALMWIAQLVLGITFLIAGFGKIFAYKHFSKLVESRTKGHPIGIPARQAAIIGAGEVFWGLLVINPFQFSYPFLLPLVGSACLALEMIGATYYHMRRKEPAGPSIALCLLAVFVIVGRWPWWG
jgi:uncharacterized membrane protein YphA (DoxX/SURF4 family)